MYAPTASEVELSSCEAQSCPRLNDNAAVCNPRFSTIAVYTKSSNVDRTVLSFDRTEMTTTRILHLMHKNSIKIL